MIQKFTQFKGASNKDSNSQIFKPFDISNTNESSQIEKEVKKDPKREVKKENKKPVSKPELSESFIPINIPPFDKIIKDLQDKVAPVKNNDLEEIQNEPEHQEPVQQIVDDTEIENPIEDQEPLIGYKIFRDKSEVFECKVSIEGASINNSSARLILDSNEWNLIFYGRIEPNGRCVIPLKKISILSEKCTGQIRLEIIADETIFVPWKETFVVVPSKKVSVEILSGERNNPEKSSIRVTGIKGR